MTCRFLQDVFSSHYAYRALNALRVWPSYRYASGACTQIDLHRWVDEARTPPRRPRRPNSGSRALGDGKGCWRCINCGVDKVAADFYLKGASVCSYCKSCSAKTSADSEKTLRGNASRLVRSARRRSMLKGWIFDLDKEIIFNLLLQQQGRCAYSGVQMEICLPHSNWRMSLERVDNKLGYEPENCVLIAAEFNTSGMTSKRVAMDEESGSSEWSMEKVQKLPAVRLLNVDLGGLWEAIEEARFRPRRLWSKPHIDHQLEPPCSLLLCSSCKLWKPPDCFYFPYKIVRGSHLYCKQCERDHSIADRTTLRGHILQLLRSARRRHKRGKWHGDFDLDLDHVLGMLWSQGGRCFYSDVPLRFAQLNVDWMISLERFDNTKTYTRQNAVLVALEFNTPDHSGRAVASQVLGSSQWSKSKVDHVWGSAARLVEV